MKRNIVVFMIIMALFSIFNASNVYAQIRQEYGEPVATYVSEEGPDIISFSKKWATERKLKEVYDELLSNFHGQELSYLKEVVLYPDSPDGTNGYYYEATIISRSGKMAYGNDAYIEVFNCDEYYHISQMAWVLTHEYGHHFTFYYMVTSENKYYNQWYDTEYARIRQLEKYPEVQYDYVGLERYMHEWDITEIAAEDYVQLFGSEKSKESKKFYDVTQRLNEGVSDYFYSNSSFNLVPQENFNLPLAAEVDGLYNYWLNLAGYTSTQPQITNKPIPTITEVQVVYMEKNKKYKLVWNEIEDDKEYEYTVVIYPKNASFFPTPIKTVYTGDEMCAYLGSDVIILDAQNSLGILENYSGEYEIRIFIKDPKGFMFSSQTLYYDFTHETSSYSAEAEDEINRIKNEEIEKEKEAQRQIVEEEIRIKAAEDRISDADLYKENISVGEAVLFNAFENSGNVQTTEDLKDTETSEIIEMIVFDHNFEGSKENEFTDNSDTQDDLGQTEAVVKNENVDSTDENVETPCGLMPIDYKAQALVFEKDKTEDRIVVWDKKNKLIDFKGVTSMFFWREFILTLRWGLIFP